MRFINMLFFTVIILMFVCIHNSHSGTIMNMDKNNYRLVVTLKNGSNQVHPIQRGATRGGICNSGCAVRIQETGSGIIMQPNQTISIQNGQLR